MTYKREDLSSVPSKDTQSHAWPLMFVISRLEVKREIWLRKKEGRSGEWLGVDDRSPRAQGHTSIPRHTCTHTNTRTRKHTKGEAPISISLWKGLILFYMGRVLCFVIFNLVHMEIISFFLLHLSSFLVNSQNALGLEHRIKLSTEKDLPIQLSGGHACSFYIWSVYKETRAFQRNAVCSSWRDFCRCLGGLCMWWTRVISLGIVGCFLFVLSAMASFVFVFQMNKGNLGRSSAGMALASMPCFRQPSLPTVLSCKC